MGNMIVPPYNKLVLLLVVLTLPIAYAVYCYDQNSGLITSVYAEASISGSSPSTSYGWGEVGGYFIQSPLYCEINAMIITIESQYLEYRAFIPIDSSYSKNFPSGTSGSYILSSVTFNFCDGTLVGVKATLYGCNR